LQRGLVELGNVTQQRVCETAPKDCPDLGIARAAAGLGVAIASTWMCAEELASGALTELMPDYALDPISAFIVFPAGARPSQKARVFANYLQQTVTGSQASSLEPTTGSAGT
jgi:DNA-binding transcriptional LysR family regulator